MIAGGWTVGAFGAETIVRLVSTLVLTRLLVPDAFGQIAAATSVLVGLQLIGDIGIRTFILQSPQGDDERFLRSAWTYQVVRGVCIWLVLAVICGVLAIPVIRSLFPAGSVFSDPEFGLITTVLGMTLIFGAMESTAVPWNVRRLNLKPLLMIELTTRAVSLAAMILWASRAPSVWVLVFGSWISSILRLPLTHFVLPGPRMVFQWNSEHNRAIVAFGKWINVSSIASFIASQSDRLLLGAVLPSSTFGLYSIARQIIDTPYGLLERLNATLTLPVLREAAHAPTQEFREKYYRFRLPFEITASLLSGVLFSAGTLIIDILFDHRYLDAGYMVQALSIGLITFPALFIGGAFTVTGEPRVSAVTSIISAISLIVFLIAGYGAGGAWGAMWGIALHKLVPVFFILSIGRKRQWIDIGREFRVIGIFASGFVIGKIAAMAIKSLGVQ